MFSQCINIKHFSDHSGVRSDPFPSGSDGRRSAAWGQRPPVVISGSPGLILPRWAWRERFLFYLQDLPAWRCPRWFCRHLRQREWLQRRPHLWTRCDCWWEAENAFHMSFHRKPWLMTSISARWLAFDFRFFTQQLKWKLLRISFPSCQMVEVKT